METWRRGGASCRSHSLPIPAGVPPYSTSLMVGVRVSPPSWPRNYSANPPGCYQLVAVEAWTSPTDSSQRSASMAARQPSPAAVIAWR